MHHHVYAEADTYPVAVLVKASAFNLSEMQRFYVNLMEKHGVNKEQLILVSVPYNEYNKAPVSFIKEHIESLFNGLRSVGVQTIFCCDSNYFKVLTKQATAEKHLGYVLPCSYDETMSVILGTNHKTVMYNPKNESKLLLSVETLASYLNNSYSELGADIIHSAHYPLTSKEISNALENLHQYDLISCDIEAASLRFEKAGIGTVSFAWSEHEGISFPVDLCPETQTFQVKPEIRKLLKDFYLNYKGTIIWHNASYDVKVLIYNLWMEDALDTVGLIDGLEVFSRSFHDTKLISYLATNSCAGNELSLKELAHEFAGNWAVDNIKDITKIPFKKLLQYNLIDSLSTMYVFNKYYPQLTADKQLDIYNDLFIPSLKTVIQLELSGMPLSASKVQEVKAQLQTGLNECLDTLTASPAISRFSHGLQIEAMNKANSKLKTKQHPLSKFSDIKYNPGSTKQTARLLFNVFSLPILDRTVTKLPATGAKTLKKLINHTDDPEVIAVLEALISYSEIEKILSSFIPAFEQAFSKDNSDTVWLHGSFNLGGTVSGRMSSSSPNLQNIPANSTYGKLIKTCFQAPKDWLFCGADFNSLEDYVSALQTKDPNKLKVYESNFDGHCLRAFYYFKDQMPDIVETPDSINSIKKKYPHLRQDSKGPTFLLTYGGTFMGMMKNLGWPEDKAKKIEAQYHELYKVSDQWVQSKLDQAAIDGYVTGAFGLRVRTPLLHKTIRNHRLNPYEAQSEARTAGNALGQSYGLLNNRAINAFMQKVWDSPYKYLIKPIALIHDAIYLLVKNDVHVVKWVNDHLIEEMQWQELPDIKHDTVKLGAELSVFWPDWSKEYSLPNQAHEFQIRSICSI